jgi:hypothetical protein
MAQLEASVAESVGVVAEIGVRVDRNVVTNGGTPGTANHAAMHANIPTVRPRAKYKSCLRSILFSLHGSEQANGWCQLT